LARRLVGAKRLIDVCGLEALLVAGCWPKTFAGARTKVVFDSVGAALEFCRGPAALPA
jgi:hypothetical protein